MHPLCSSECLHVSFKPPSPPPRLEPPAAPAGSPPDECANGEGHPGERQRPERRQAQRGVGGVGAGAFAGNVDAVQAQLTRFLKPLGYRKRGRTFNRDAAECVLRVIDLQIAGYPDPDDQEP